MYVAIDQEYIEFKTNYEEYFFVLISKYDTYYPMVENSFFRYYYFNLNLHY